MYLIVSNCCQQPVIAVGNNDGTANFVCTVCKKGSDKAQEGRSHCCLAPMMQGDQFPFICESCNRPCECALPTTPTHQETYRDFVMYVLQKMKDGQITIVQAHECIIKNMEEEVQLGVRDFADVIKHCLNKFSPNEMPPDMMSHFFFQGVDTAVQGLKNAIDEAVG